MTECLTILLTGDFIRGLTCPFEQVIGVWFFAIMIATMQITIAVKFRSIMSATVLGLMSSTLMLPFIPVYMQWIPLMMFIVNIAAVLYLMFIREE